MRLKRKTNRDTIHFTADASNTELSYRTIHSANQLRIYGAVACWFEEFGLEPDETSERLTKTENDQILKEVRPQEVNSLVQTPRNDEPATANRLRECEQNFETLEKEIQFMRVCEEATEDTTEQSWTWMMVSEIEPPHAENTHILVRTLIPGSMLPFRNEQVLQVHINKSFLALMELKFRYHQRLRLRARPGWSFAEDRTASWTRYPISNKDPIPRVRNTTRERERERRYKIR